MNQDCKREEDDVRTQLSEFRCLGKVLARTEARIHGSYTEHFINSSIKKDFPSWGGL